MIFFIHSKTVQQTGGSNVDSPFDAEYSSKYMIILRVSSSRQFF